MSLADEVRWEVTANGTPSEEEVEAIVAKVRALEVDLICAVMLIPPNIRPPRFYKYVANVAPQEVDASAKDLAEGRIMGLAAAIASTVGATREDIDEAIAADKAMREKHSR